MLNGEFRRLNFEFNLQFRRGREKSRLQAEKQVVINSSLDARQAAFFVQTASKYDCRIQVMIDNKKINAKSIMGTIALGMIEGKLAVITAEGSDAEQAVNELAGVLA